MRCKACDVGLTDYESTRKSVITGEYLDLCNECYKYIKEDVHVIDNPENLNIQDILDFEEDS